MTELPTIPNAIYRAVMWMARHGLFQECEYVLSLYKLDATQKRLYDEEILNAHKIYDK